jgi:endogenous inhibitor of DNA gyrase (YacG/DUF329 family)
MQGQSAAEWPQFPFCSGRCRLIDLGRWLGEDYRIARAEEDTASSSSDDSDNP